MKPLSFHFMKRTPPKKHFKVLGHYLLCPSPLALFAQTPLAFNFQCPLYACIYFY